jgi:hypothetical protein
MYFFFLHKKTRFLTVNNNEPVFVKPLGAQESIPSLVESIPGLLNVYNFGLWYQSRMHVNNGPKTKATFSVILTLSLL